MNCIEEPRMLLDEDSQCYGCKFYRHIDDVKHDHTYDDYDENNGTCDIDCVCVNGNMNGYRIVY